MAKRVSIIMPDKMSPGPSKDMKPLKPSLKTKSSIKNHVLTRTESETPVFVVVSKESSHSGQTSSRLTTSEHSSLENPPGDCSEASTADTYNVDGAEESHALVQSSTTNSLQLQTRSIDSAGSSIKQFLRNTVDLVKAGESFTSVRQLFYNFVKRSGYLKTSSMSIEASPGEATQLQTESTYPSQSNDTMFSDLRMSDRSPRPNFPFDPLKYDFNSLLSEVTPLTGYTPVRVTDSAEKGNSQHSVLGGTSKSLRSTSGVSLPPQSSPKKILRKSPKISPRSPSRISFPSITPSVGSNLKLSGGARQGSNRSLAKVTPSATPGISANSDPMQPFVIASGDSPHLSSGSRSSTRKSTAMVKGINEDSAITNAFAFTLVSPEEAEQSQPTEGEGTGTGAVEEGSTNCQTYQEDCKCHHCQDMRCAVKRVEYFQSPKGQHQMEAKLLAKNFFMDLSALTMVRKQIQADLHGTRRYPPARISFPVSICGANRLDAGSLSLDWFTHDLDNVDHFEFFVDDVPSRTVYNLKATSTVLIDVDARETHRLKMRAVPVRGCCAEASAVDKFMAEVAAGHMKHVRQGDLFACCLKVLDSEPQHQSVESFWTASEYLYMPTCECSKSAKPKL
ncbi:hypothetical protein KR009_010080 [Drosophila setifemur]|nr:hypothetical protein KR009_010080 [Drosophila setifemur]